MARITPALGRLEYIRIEGTMRPQRHYSVFGSLVDWPIVVRKNEEEDLTYAAAIV
jgi:hypothetical protein